MKSISVLLACAWTVLMSPPVPASDAPPIHHDLSVRLDPAAHRIDVTDRIALEDSVRPHGSGDFRFALHAGLAPRVETPGWKLEREEGPIDASFFGINVTTETVFSRVPLEGWRLVRDDPARRSVTIRYGGVIHHPLEQQPEEYQRSFSETPGVIADDGVFLAGATFWTPFFGDGLITFRLEARGLTPPWDVVSQGKRVVHETTEGGTRTTAWECTNPVEEVYLVAGPWTEYADRTDEVDLYAFLRTPDPALAGRYLAATKRFLAMYHEMLPRYPYPSFALVENFWETGYGMPGFTLLGPRIIRFPWILTSSYPHEILHNWWGNSVYVNADGGNWCEGLTAYLADHLFAEQRGEAATYRRATLKRFTDFVRSGEDSTLREFRSRHSRVSEAVGYGKSLMLFHMARLGLGDDAFVRALSRFAEEFRFRRASFADLAAALAAEGGESWKRFFDVWVSRPGAPVLEIARAEVFGPSEDERGWTVSVSLRQVQPEEPFPVSVPVAVTAEDLPEPVTADVVLTGREATIEILCPARPLRLDVDPAFDTMRRLDPLEVPPALSTLFGEKRPLFVLPGEASEEEKVAWRELAEAWTEEGEARVVLDTDVRKLPVESFWVLGWSNRLGSRVASWLEPRGVALDDAGLGISEEAVPRSGHASVVVARHPDEPSLAVAWVTADPVAAIPGLARKLPHYTRYSYLGFRGEEPENFAKGMWQPVASPLARNLTDRPMPAAKTAARLPLVEPPPIFDAASLRRTVEVLAAPERRGRGLGTEGLAWATEWVEQQLRSIGLDPAGEDGFRQTWSWTGGDPVREMTLTNLFGRVPGSDASLADRPVLVMAHLDHLGTGWPDVREGNRGKVHPGADDNASGVAVLLELAREMAAAPPAARPVLFAVVTAEEAGRLGSKRLLESLASSDIPFACVNLDTVGRLGDGKLLVLNAGSAREWRFIFMGVQYTTGVPISIVSEPLDSSDQVSCIEHGAPAVQLFTGPNADYHRPSDTREKIDADGMARVAEAAHEAAAYLAGRTEPLTVTIESGKGPPRPAAGPAGERRASLGTMPDFAFPGPGVRVQQVMPGSAAEAAGIAAGDVVIGLDGEEVTDLRRYSSLLKAHAPGDEIELTVRRDGETLTIRAVLKAR